MSQPAGAAAPLPFEVVQAGPLTLRPWRADDVAWVFDACQDAEIQRWTRVPSPYTARDAVAFVEGSISEREAGREARFAIELTESGELLGSISLRPNLAEATAEIGYWVARDARGSGVASLALAGMAGWAAGRFGLGSLTVIVARGNAASTAVARRAGFVPAAVVAGGCKDGSEPDDGIVHVLAVPG